jgi:hypothetical protein
MEKAEIRKQFEEFLGTGRYMKFLGAITTVCLWRDQLLFWQSEALESFRAATGVQLPDDLKSLGPIFLLCHLHREELQYDRVPIVYGTTDGSNPHWKLQEEKFPHASYFVLGGCVVEDQKYDDTFFCASCRRAYDDYNYHWARKEPDGMPPADMVADIEAWRKEMLTDDEIDAIAKEHMRNTCAPDSEILHREVRSYPDGIYFIANRRGPDRYIGSGGFFVTRSSGEVWAFGSGQISNEGLDYWLKWQAQGWRIGTYRLTVLEAPESRMLAQLLHQCGVGYQLRELAQGAVCTRRVAADLEEILDRLATLPCTFLVSADDLRAILPYLRRWDIAQVEYSYIGATPQYDWRPENNTPDMLGRQ